jgi:hypothetical protein
MDTPATPAAPAPAPEPKWNLFVLLPSLRVEKVGGMPTPFRSEVMQICSGDDPVLKQLDGNAGDKTMLALCEQFSSYYGQKYGPACLLIRVGAPESFITVEAISTFRNVCALATVTFGAHYVIRGDGSGDWMQNHSDHFLFCPELALKTGNGIWKKGTIVTGWTDEIHRYHGHPTHQIDSPENFRLSVDVVLLERLLRVWRSVFDGGAESPATRRLFRALEVAFHAALHPNVSFGTNVNDLGTRIGLWVSAFEILCRPDDRTVNKTDVFSLLARAEWNEGSPLRDQKFTARWQGREIPVTFPEKVYDEIYAARNAFMHGNPVTEADLKLRCVPGGQWLAALAPVLFNVALRSYLANELPEKASEEELIRDGLFYFSNIEEALRIAMGEPEVPTEGVTAEMIPPPES